MNSAILINTFSNGGAEKVLSSLLSKTKKKVVVYTIWNDIAFDLDGVLVTPLLSKKGILALDLLLALYKLIKLIRRDKVCSVNSFLFWSNYINIVASFFCKHKTYTTHCVSIESKFGTTSLLSRFHMFASSILLPKATVNIFKSKDMQVEYCSLFNINDRDVIYNPVDNIGIQSFARQNTDYFEFKPNVCYIACVGRFHATKQQCKLIDTLSLLPANYEIIFMGGGQLLEDCKRLSRSLGLSQRTHFLGNIDNPYQLVTRCELFVSVSESEGFPNALLEAIALGCYPIVYDCPTGPSEIVSLGFERSPQEIRSKFEVYDLGVLLKDNSPVTVSESIQFVKQRQLFIDNETKEELIERLTFSKILCRYEAYW